MRTDEPPPRHDLPARELHAGLDRNELRDRYYGLLKELRVVLSGAQVLVTGDQPTQSALR